MNKEISGMIAQWTEEELLKLDRETLRDFGSSDPKQMAVSEMVAALVAERIRKKATQDERFRFLLPKRWRDELLAGGSKALLEFLTGEIYHDSKSELDRDNFQSALEVEINNMEEEC